VRLLRLFRGVVDPQVMGSASDPSPLGLCIVALGMNVLICRISRVCQPGGGCCGLRPEGLGYFGGKPAT
jgi:hypothetical protein